MENNTTTAQVQGTETKRVASALTILKSINGNIKHLTEKGWDAKDIQKLTEVAANLRKEVLKEI